MGTIDLAKILREKRGGGMAFDPDYIVLGNGKQQVKQLGNAVTPPVMKMILERCIETLK